MNMNKFRNKNTTKLTKLAKVDIVGPNLVLTVLVRVKAM